MLLSFQGKFFVSMETDDSKNIFGRFLETFWVEEKGQESIWIGQRPQRVVELKKSNFEGLQPQFCIFF